MCYKITLIFSQLVCLRCQKRYLHKDLIRSCNTVHTRKALRAAKFPNLEIFCEFRLSFPLRRRKFR